MSNSEPRSLLPGTCRSGLRLPFWHRPRRIVGFQFKESLPSENPDREPALRRALGFLAGRLHRHWNGHRKQHFPVVPSDMIKAVGSPAMVFAVWVFGGVLTLFGALSYAELSAALAGCGRENTSISDAAYSVPFSDLFTGGRRRGLPKALPSPRLRPDSLPISRIFSRAFRRAAYTRCITQLAPAAGRLKSVSGRFLAISLILFLAGINYFGVRLGGGVQVGVTALKLALIALLDCSGSVVRDLHPRETPGANLHSGHELPIQAAWLGSLRPWSLRFLGL